MTTTPEAPLSFESKSGRKKTPSRFSAKNRKNPDRARLCGLSYLVVDHSRITRSTVKDALNGIGIRAIVEIEDAERALRHAEHHPVDAIIVDYEIPGVNGAEFVWRLRRSPNERTRQIPVIMVSDHADQSRVQIALDAGVSEYLAKPFSQTDLYTRLRRSVLAPKPFVVAPDYVGPDRRLLMNGARNGIERRCALTPADLLDQSAETGTEPIAAQEPARPAAKPAAKPKPSYSALSEYDPSGGDAESSLSRRLKERIKGERGLG